MAGIGVGQTSPASCVSSDENTQRRKMAEESSAMNNLSFKQIRTNEKRALTKLLNGAQTLMGDNGSPNAVKTFGPLILAQLRACEVAHERYVKSEEFQLPKKGTSEEYIAAIKAEVHEAVTKLECYVGEKMAEFVVRNTTLLSEDSEEEGENYISLSRAQCAASALQTHLSISDANTWNERNTGAVLPSASQQVAENPVSSQFDVENQVRSPRPSSATLISELQQERWKLEQLQSLLRETGQKKQELANKVEQLEDDLHRAAQEYREQSERFARERQEWQSEQKDTMQALMSRINQLEVTTRELQKPTTFGEEFGVKPRISSVANTATAASSWPEIPKRLEIKHKPTLGGDSNSVFLGSKVIAAPAPMVRDPPPMYTQSVPAPSKVRPSRTSTPTRTNTQVLSDSTFVSSLDNSVILETRPKKLFGGSSGFQQSAAGPRYQSDNTKPTFDSGANVHSARFNFAASPTGWPLQGQNAWFNESTPPFSHGHRSIFRHPKVDVEKYDGDPIKWPEFAAMFKDMVDSDPYLSLQGKMTLLKACLTQDVRNSIGECLTSPSLYFEAVRQLERTYGHPDRIAKAHRQVIQDLPQVRHLKEFRALVNLSNSLHGAVTSLKGGGFDGELKANSLLDSVLEKIPDELRSEWGRLVYNAFPTRLSLDEFDTWLKDVVAAQMIVQPVKTVGNRVTDYKPSKGGKAAAKPSVYVTRTMAEGEEGFVPETTAVHQVTQTVKVAASPECPLCKGTHTLCQCDVFKRMKVEERAVKVAEINCCFKCLKRGHRIRECYKKKKKCEVQGCDKGHHTLLHGAPTVSKQSPKADSSLPVASVGTNRKADQAEDVLLAVVPITVAYGEKSVDTYGLLDNGAETTLILRSLADELELPGPVTPCRIGTFHGNDPVVDTRKVSFVIKTRDGGRSYTVKSAYATPQIQLSKYQYNWPKSKCRWPHIAELDIPPIDSSKVRVLIGRNVRGVHSVMEERVAPDEDGPDAILTPFGWCVVGPIPARRESKKPRVNLLRFETENDLERLWLEEKYGPDKRVVPISDSEQRGLDILNRSIRHNGERYEVGLMLKRDDLRLPNPEPYVKAQFLAMERQCLRNPVFGDTYHRTMQGYFDDGVAIPVSDQEAVTEGRVWYLPHHGVVSPSKPGKVRIVHNCSAVFNQVSLNDCLLKGPDLMANLFGVLLRFRHRRYAISGDIKGMFHQVGVIPEDQSLLRFLYRRPGSAEPIQVFKMVRHVFGAVSSPTTCIFTLRRTAEDNQHLCPSVRNFAVDHTYVDNVLLSTDTEDSLIDSFRQCREVCARGGFSLVQVMANTRNALTGFAPAELSKPINLSCDKLPTEKILGLHLDWNSDEFVFQPTESQNGPATMRLLLSAVSSIYDPHGFLSAVVISARTLLQDCWRLQLKWDDPLPTGLESVFSQGWRELSHLTKLRIPRSLRSLPNPSEVSLHSFSDASEAAFGSAVYYRAVYPNGEISVRLIAGKARVAPIRQRSIPRLELQGAVQSLRITSNAVAELQFDVAPVVTYWVDSQTVLEWIHSKTCKYHAFVGHRITEILEASTADQWRHVPGELNPADDATRGIRAKDLDTKHRWLAGPPFLRQPKELWPPNILLKEPSAMDPEVAPFKWIGLTRVTKLNVLFVYAQRTSSWERYLHVIGWLDRFVNNYYNLGPIVTNKYLTVGELKWARVKALRLDQRCFFAAELVALHKEKPLHSTSPIQALTPFVDNQGLLRAEGRLERGPFGDQQKHPIILHNSSPVARMIILRLHQQVAHEGVERTLSELRQEYHVIRARQTVRKYVTQCPHCRRAKVQPDIPLMAALPASRLYTHLPPFTIVGVDYFGPVTVTVGRRTEKRYGVLLTCMVTRAVHIEMAWSLDAESFLHAFWRFTARRGMPREVWSDNGTNFIAGEKELKESLAAFDSNHVSDQLARRHILWRFNPPAAPHFGGSWERLVRSAKSALRFILHDHKLTDEVLLTALVGVENLLNGRPLTHVTVDPKEPEPLTPFHFLLGRPNSNPIPDRFENEETGRRPTLKTWRHSQSIISHFWNRWLKEYVPELIERRKWLKSSRDIRRGDIVLVVDPMSPRGEWSCGRVIDIYPGADGVVRTAKVKTKKGEYVRLTTKLCLLEAEEDT